MPSNVSARPARHRDLREANLGLVLRAVAATPRASRARLAASTGLTKATVSSLVEQLLAGGLVVELDPVGSGGSGRPGSPVALDRLGPAGLGIEINVDYLAVCLVDLAGDVLGSRVVATEHRGCEPGVAVERAVEVGRELLARHAGAGPAGRARPIAGVAVAAPGPVARAAGVLVSAPNLGWAQVSLAALVGSRLGLPTAVDNEASYAALAEHWFGAAVGIDDFVYVSGEIGVGGGIVLGGQLFRGMHGFAGELGHVCVDPDGERCGCGARGCLETVAGQDALLRGAGVSLPAGSRLGDPDGAASTLVARAAAGDVATVRALQRAGRALGIGLASVVNVVDVDTVVLGGSYAGLAPWLLEPLRTELAARVLVRSPAHAQPRLVVSDLGTSAAVRGAASAVVRAVIDDPASWLARVSSAPASGGVATAAPP